MMLVIEKLEELYQIKSLYFKNLIGAKSMFHSIRVNQKIPG